MISSGYLQQFTQICLGLPGYRQVFLAAVTHFHHRHATAVPVKQFLARLLQDGFWQDRRPGTEIIDFRHG